MKDLIPKTDRPYNVALSQAEVVALVKWNIAQAKRVTKIFGQEVLKTQATSAFPTRAKVDALRKVCQAKMEEHGQRARGLASILK